jgi:hypothetical protein
MNNYYTHTTKSWYPEEDAQLLREHKYRNYTIVQLAHIHKRTPDSVIKRLRRLGKINSTTDIRGYEEYRNSSLFYILNPDKQAKEEIKKEINRPLEPISEDDEEESVIDYTKADTLWNKEEDVQLFKLQARPLLQIANSLNRHPGDVACQMKKLKIVKAYHLINGFDVYKNTPLYAEYQKAHRKKKAPYQDTSPTGLLKGEMGEIKSEMSSIKDELAMMRESFVDLRRFISQSFEEKDVIKSAVKKVYHLNRHFR